MLSPCIDGFDRIGELGFRVDYISRQADTFAGASEPTLPFYRCPSSAGVPSFRDLVLEALHSSTGSFRKAPLAAEMASAQLTPEAMSSTTDHPHVIACTQECIIEIEVARSCHMRTIRKNLMHFGKHAQVEFQKRGGKDSRIGLSWADGLADRQIVGPSLNRRSNWFFAKGRRNGRQDMRLVSCNLANASPLAKPGVKP
ncbi:unnamed protein product [Protopolystoma xenopodis]|uniref:Uncharacterized protein n=1 Tax=Protopolystoma xenopodis TaxID=117903 RepID=A0A3S5CH96_9PLAT|nr:unnamed protein product [Protopolystoma xenopodis]